MSEVLEFPYGSTIPFTLSDVIGLDEQPIADLGTCQEITFTLVKENGGTPILKRKKSLSELSIQGPAAYHEITATVVRQLLQPNQIYLFDYKGRDSEGRELTPYYGRILLNPVPNPSAP